jgi:3-hydroxymyristoyl/3-hydroxydecanoyl-(acyl carrier protein) dehydratase
MNGPVFEQMVCIDAAHPALPGHFPGDPLVPGVILLEQVALAIRAWRGQRMARVLEAKFMAPLLPAQTATLRLTEAAPNGSNPGRTNLDNPDKRIRFEIRHDNSLLARGIVEAAT